MYYFIDTKAKCICLSLSLSLSHTQPPSLSLSQTHITRHTHHLSPSFFLSLHEIPYWIDAVISAVTRGVFAPLPPTPDPSFPPSCYTLGGNTPFLSQLPFSKLLHLPISKIIIFEEQPSPLPLPPQKTSFDMHAGVRSIWLYPRPPNPPLPPPPPFCPLLCLYIMHAPAGVPKPKWQHFN